MKVVAGCVVVGQFKAATTAAAVVVDQFTWLLDCLKFTLLLFNYLAVEDSNNTGLWQICVDVLLFVCACNCCCSSLQEHNSHCLFFVPAAIFPLSPLRLMSNCPMGWRMGWWRTLSDGIAPVISGVICGDHWASWMPTQTLSCPPPLPCIIIIG